jgi:hypothetical protein
MLPIRQQPPRPFAHEICRHCRIQGDQIDLLQPFEHDRRILTGKSCENIVNYDHAVPLSVRFVQDMSAYNRTNIPKYSIP